MPKNTPKYIYFFTFKSFLYIDRNWLHRFKGIRAKFTNFVLHAKFEQLFVFVYTIVYLYKLTWTEAETAKQNVHVICNDFVYIDEQAKRTHQ